MILKIRLITYFISLKFIINTVIYFVKQIKFFHVSFKVVQNKALIAKVLTRYNHIVTYHKNVENIIYEIYISFYLGSNKGSG